MRWVLVGLLVGSCGDDGLMRGGEGEPCSDMTDCGHMLDCYRGRCVPFSESPKIVIAGAGEPCGGYTRCGPGVECFKGFCRRRYAEEGEPCSSSLQHECDRPLVCLDDVCVTEKARDEAERKHAETRMLAKSGVPDAGVAERVEGAAGQRIRVATVAEKSTGYAFAACRSDERLIGGGCEGGGLSANRPDAFSGVDTVGARWVCRTSSKVDVTAFALCAAIPKP